MTTHPSDVRVDAALALAAAGERLSPDDALALLASDALLELGEAATATKRRRHDDGEAMFVIDRNINYSNVCITDCTFCNFYRPPGHAEAYTLDRAEIFARMEETLALGGTAVMMQGGHNPELGIEWYEELLSATKARFGSRVTLHCFGPPEIAHIGRVSRISTREVLERLKAAGLDSLPGAGAEVLVERPRRLLAPKKLGAVSWLRVMRQAHEVGFKSTTATMMFGGPETLEERVEHLRRVREVQDAAPSHDDGARGFLAFIPWTMQATGTQWEEGFVATTGVEYLRFLAVSRLFLDNVSHLGSSWLTIGNKVGLAGLDFGADDLGSIMIEENVVSAAGASARMGAAEITRAIQSTGRVAIQRDTYYRPVRRYPAGAVPEGTPAFANTFVPGASA